MAIEASKYTRKAQGLGPDALVQAARLRDDWEQKIVFTEDLDPIEESDLENAIDVLEARFPHLDQVHVGQSEDYAQGRGFGTGSGAKAGTVVSSRKPDAEALSDADAAAASVGNGGSSHTRSGGGRRSPQRTAARARRGRRRTSSGRLHRYGRQTGIPGAAASTTEVVLSTLGLIFGVSLAYLLLSSSEKGGFAAFPAILGGITGFMNRLIEPVDILGGFGSKGPAPVTPQQLSQLLPPKAAGLPGLHRAPKPPAPIHPGHVP